MDLDDDKDNIEVQIVAIDFDIGEIDLQIQGLLERQRQLKFERLVLVEKKHAKKAAQTTRLSGNFGSTDFPWSKQLEETLKSTFKVGQLRPFQLPTMNATMAGHDCILVMPTGGGKSLCFQLPALLSKGITLVVSPLLSLMEDQVMALKALNVNAEMLTANTSKQQQNAVLQALIDPKAELKILYVTPEKLSKSKRFMAKVEKMYEMGRFARLAVDEVHCCSQWGHDFRRDYKFLGVFKRQFPKVPILGLTATATARVTSDVQSMLNIEDCLVYRASFNRPNLVYKIHPKPSSHKEVVEELARLIRSSYAGQSGIVYCFSIKEAEEVAQELQRRNIKALPYHANLDPNYRSKVHHQWIANECHVVVATIAFGMGIDKPDVRFVIHHSLSKSTENFYQESGRAGRDDKPADCIVLYRFADVFRQSCMVFTDKTGLTNLHTMVNYCIERKRCRRFILAEHFGERWQASNCNNMCDNCNPLLAHGGSRSRQTELVDVSEHCRNLYQILDKATGWKPKLTGLKLMDAWLGKGPTNVRVAGIDPPTYAREECERIVVFLLLEGYLEEKFHYTPYNTISYIMKGSRAALLTNPAHPIKMELLKRSPRTLTPKASASSMQSGSNVRIKPCIVNKSNSKLGRSIPVGGIMNIETGDEGSPTTAPSNTSIDIDLLFSDSNSSVKFMPDVAIDKPGRFTLDSKGSSELELPARAVPTLKRKKRNNSQKRAKKLKKLSQM